MQRNAQGRRFQCMTLDLPLSSSLIDSGQFTFAIMWSHPYTAVLSAAAPKFVLFKFELNVRLWQFWVSRLKFRRWPRRLHACFQVLQVIFYIVYYLSSKFLRLSKVQELCHIAFGVDQLLTSFWRVPSPSTHIIKRVRHVAYWQLELGSVCQCGMAENLIALSWFHSSHGLYWWRCKDFKRIKPSILVIWSHTLSGLESHDRHAKEAAREVLRYSLYRENVLLRIIDWC